MIFIDDRGPGFDPDAIPDDRQGVRESIIGRMKRYGGRAEIRSGPGDGTEIELAVEGTRDDLHPDRGDRRRPRHLRAG